MNYHENRTFIRNEYPSDVTIITRHDLLKNILTLDKKIKTMKYLNI